MNMREQLTERVGKPHLSYSSLKYALGDMRLWEMYMRGQLKKESEALQFGSLYDLLLFEPEKFNDVYYTLDDSSIVASIGGTYPRSTKRYKEWKAEAAQTAENADKILASEADVKKAKEMIQRLKEGDYIVDSKSSRSIDKFRYDVNSFSYDIQAYIYTKVFGLKDFYWVVQEKAYPFYPADVKCSEETLFRGEMKFHQALENIQKYLNEDQRSEEHFAEFIV